MKLGFCKKCKKIRFLTRHHVSPIRIIFLCRSCHDEEDGMNPPKPKTNRKYARGTKRMHKGGWKK